VFTVCETPLPYESGYHMCNTCGTYGRVKAYTSFYFVFAVFFYYLTVQPHRECRTCMRSRVWKTLAANLPFVIGTPPALWQIARAYWPASGPLATLDYANYQAKKKRLERAIHEYEVIQQKVRHCASVRYNHSLALHAANKPAEAVKKLEQALADCANFRPAYAALTRCYGVLQMTDRLDGLLRSWSYAESLGAGQ
jgi:tetratricopeptide (TPR) repeat protein